MAQTRNRAAASPEGRKRRRSLLRHGRSGFSLAAQRSGAARDRRRFLRTDAGRSARAGSARGARRCELRGRRRHGAAVSRPVFRRGDDGLFHAQRRRYRCDAAGNPPRAAPRSTLCESRYEQSAEQTLEGSVRRVFLPRRSAYRRLCRRITASVHVFAAVADASSGRRSAARPFHCGGIQGRRIRASHGRRDRHSLRCSMIDRKPRTDASLYSLIEDFFRNTFTTDNPLITEAIKRMLAAGGKRLRPRVTLLAAEATGGNAEDHLHLAAYMELIHVATLIHDDVVDNAQTRRGVNATAVDYGNRISVLAGDYLFAWIFKNVTAGYPHPIPHILSSTLADITDGEVLQLKALADVETTLDEYVEIATKKTASLFAASAECGALAAGGSPFAAKAMRDFGTAYGIAFQMRDDLLDLTSDEATLGKPVGNDLRERKMTVPLVLALQRGDRDFRADVERFFAEDDGSRERIAGIVAGIGAQGGIARTEAALAGFIERAKQSLAPLGNAPARSELVALADAL